MTTTYLNLIDGQPVPASTGLTVDVIDPADGERFATLPRSTIVSLFADVDWLYGKFGFAVPRASVGMMLRDWPTS